MTKEKSVSLDNKIITLRLAGGDEINSCCNMFWLLLEEIKDLPENNLLNTEDNLSLFRMMLIGSLDKATPVVAIHDGDVVGGFLCIPFMGFQMNKKILQAFGSYVFPQYRSKGLSKLMCEFGYEAYRSLGFHEIIGKVIMSHRENEVNESLGLETITLSKKVL